MVVVVDSLYPTVTWPKCPKALGVFVPFRQLQTIILKWRSPDCPRLCSNLAPCGRYKPRLRKILGSYRKCAHGKKQARI